MLINIDISEKDLKMLIKKHIESTINRVINIDDVGIYVKSKQNYKSQWEKAAFKAEYRKNE